MPPHALSRSQVLDHLGLGAGLCAARGMGEGLDQATKHNPARRDLTVGEAVPALGLHGRGGVTQARALVPPCFHHQPTDRRLAPRGAAGPLHDDAGGRALETLYPYGVTALYRLMAVQAAKGRGLAPPLAPRDPTRFQVDGRAHSAQAPDDQGVPSTRGSRRAHRPALPPGRRAVMGEPPAGRPVRLQPLRGHRSAGPAVGQGVQAHRAPWHPTSGTPSGVAARALSSEANRPALAKPQLKWIPRGPAPWSDAHAALAHAAPPAMPPLPEGDRSPTRPSPAGGVAPRWLLSASAPRQPPASRPGAQHLLKPSAPDSQAWPPRCGTALAWAAEAPQAWARAAPLSPPGAPPPRGAPRSSRLPGRWGLGRRARGTLRPQRPPPLWHPGHPCTRRDPTRSAPGGARGPRPTAGGTRGALCASPAVARRLALPHKARTSPGAAEGDARVLGRVCRLGISPPPGPQSPGGDLTRPNRDPPPDAHCPGGLPCLWRDALAMAGRPRASGAPSPCGPSASAAAAWPTIHAVVGRQRCLNMRRPMRNVGTITMDHERGVLAAGADPRRMSYAIGW